ncbi:MAG: pilus assembly protein [Cardiobacteriaceae bacterium]|nr:pilus assembly protein [Cardiobacteriaceae bacterium]
MKTLNSHKKESGVVLLAVLVFLLILLATLRFMLNSSQMDEIKAGADFDETLARETAMMALKEAEDYIMRRRTDGEILTTSSSSSSSSGSSSSSSTKTAESEDEIMDNAYQYWNDEANWNSVGGIIDGRGSNKACEKEACMDQRSSDEWTQVKCDETKFLCLGGTDTAKASQGLSSYTKTTGDHQARYVIEVFDGKSNAFGGASAGLNAADQDIFVFRVTAAGYSQDPTQNATATPVLLQATYVLTKN